MPPTTGSADGQRGRELGIALARAPRRGPRREPPSGSSSASRGDPAKRDRPAPSRTRICTRDAPFGWAAQSSPMDSLRGKLLLAGPDAAGPELPPHRRADRRAHRGGRDGPGAQPPVDRDRRRRRARSRLAGRDGRARLRRRPGRAQRRDRARRVATTPTQAAVLVEDDLGFVPGEPPDPDAAAQRRAPRARVRRPRRLGPRSARGRAGRGGVDHRAAGARPRSSPRIPTACGRSVLRRKGREFALLSTMPLDPTLN